MNQPTVFGLLRSRRFGPFFLTQFLGAFNDNIFRNALTILVIYQGAEVLGMTGDVLANAVLGLFVLPLFLFSGFAGQLADKYEKSMLIRRIKLAEILIMALGAWAFFSGATAVLLLVLFLMATQSAFFGPVKYGLLPQHLRDEELMGGNGLIEMGTFLAILLGILTGGLLVSFAGVGPEVVAVTVLVFAVAGYLASRRVPEAAPEAPELRINWNPFSETLDCIRHAAERRTVLLSVLGVSWFWFLGALYLAQLPNFTRATLGGGEEVGTALLAIFSVGIGVGSVLCDRLSRHRVELGLVPFGAIGVTLFGLDLYFASPVSAAEGELLGVWAFLADSDHWRILLDLALIGLFGGFYIVPLYALIQQRARPETRSRVIAANNVLNALFMVLASLIAIVFLGVLGFSIPQLFLFAAVLNAAVSIYIFTLVPEFLMRFLVWLLISTVYRVRAKNLEAVPERGGVLLVSNHVSYVDALVIMGMVRRPVRFVMYHRIFHIPILSFIFRTGKAIPIAPKKEDPAMLETAYEAIDTALANGEVVCIFPEGALSADGEIQDFKPGVERIVARRPVPVVPLALQGLWGSWFSRHRGRAFFKLPRGVFSKIGLVAGDAQPGETVTAPDLQQLVQSLRGDWA